MRIAVLTGGGDCAGLNAAIRAVVRTARHRLNTDVVGYQRGWNGILEGDSILLDNDTVRGVLSHGGTMLGTSRSHPDLLQRGAQPLIDQLRRDQVDALVAIGGDGTLHTTKMLHEAGFPVVAIPKTIDNDVFGTDVCVGYDTALTVATDAVDRLHTTAESHDRLMVLEVMGRHAGHLAAGAGIAGGAAAVLIPEQPFDIDHIADQLIRRHQDGRNASIVVVAEGATPIPDTIPEYDPVVDHWGRPRLGGMGELVGRLLAKLTGYETRTTVLGHIQRGGSPTASDRLVASTVGAASIEALASGGGGNLIGISNSKVTLRPITEIAGKTRRLSREQIDLLVPMTTAADMRRRSSNR